MTNGTNCVNINDVDHNRADTVNFPLSATDDIGHPLTVQRRPTRPTSSMTFGIAMNETIQAIKRRRSVRKFRPKPISDKIIMDILDCARLAPTGSNSQPWLFGAVTDSSLKRRIAHQCRSGRFIRHCAVCFAVFADEEARHCLEDASAATVNILLACTAHGIGSCRVGAYKKDYAGAVRELLNVPGNYILIALVAAGFSDERPSPRKKSLDDIIFFNRASSDLPKGDGNEPRPRGRFLRLTARRLRKIRHFIGTYGG